MLHALLFITIYILGFIFTFISNGIYSFVLYELVYFFSPLQRWWSYIVPSISYSFFTVILMFIAVFIKSRTLQSTNKLLSVPQFKWIYLLLLLYSVAWLYAVHPEEHLVALINYLKLIIIISLAYKLIDTSKNLDYALWGYIFGSWYISFLTWQTGRNSGNRVEGIGTVDSPDSNGIAAALAPSLVICLYYFWISKNKYLKLVFSFTGVVILNALILINSRAAFLAIAISIMLFMYYLYFSSFQRKYQKATVILLTICGISGMVYLADESVMDRLRTMTIQNTEVDYDQQTASTRFIFWKYALEITKDHPFGSGLKGFDYYAPFYLPEDLEVGANRNRSVHSTWFEALTEIGYLGVSILLILIYASYKSTRKCIQVLKEKEDYENYLKVITLQAALLAYIVAMSFMNRFRAELLYWLILYTACAYNIYVIKASEIISPTTDNKRKNAR